MDIKWQALILTGLILLSLTLTRIDLFPFGGSSSAEGPLATTSEASTDLSFQRAALLNFDPEVKRSPTRKWQVLDPQVNAEAVLIQSLDEHFPFFHYKTYENWPMASLSKLLTSVIVLEEIGEDKKIPIDQDIVATEGEAGGLRSGEIYSARDLLKIMLLSSSNDAAAAFESYLGGKEEMTRLINRKVRQLGMSQTLLHDGSGLSDLNQSTASDLRRLAQYILQEHPEIFNWTRLPNILVQPTNDIETGSIYNINPFVTYSNFLGGKTGTSPRARENFLGLFSVGEYRLLVIVLGSPNRVQETNRLLDWVQEAYQF